MRLCLCDSRVAFLGRPGGHRRVPPFAVSPAPCVTGCLCGKPSPWYCRAFRQILPCLKHKTIAIFFVQALFGPSLPPSCPHLKAQCVALFFGAASGHLQVPPSPSPQAFVWTGCLCGKPSQNRCPKFLGLARKRAIGTSFRQLAVPKKRSASKYEPVRASASQYEPVRASTSQDKSSVSPLLGGTGSGRLPRGPELDGNGWQKTVRTPLGRLGRGPKKTSTLFLVPGPLFFSFWGYTN